MTFEETRATLNPRALAVKNLEMSVRAGDTLAAICHIWEATIGSKAHVLPPEWYALPKQLAAEAAKDGIVYRDHWAWGLAFKYWRTGGHDRIKAQLMDQLPDENRARVDKHKQWLEKEVAKWSNG